MNDNTKGSGEKQHDNSGNMEPDRNNTPFR